jgi:hypothetical protein
MQKMETPILNLTVIILINPEDSVGLWKSLNQAAAVNGVIMNFVSKMGGY